MPVKLPNEITPGDRVVGGQGRHDSFDSSDSESSDSDEMENGQVRLTPMISTSTTGRMYGTYTQPGPINKSSIDAFDSGALPNLPGGSISRDGRMAGRTVVAAADDGMGRGGEAYAEGEGGMEVDVDVDVDEEMDEEMDADEYSLTRVLFALSIGIFLQFYTGALLVYFKREIHADYLPYWFHSIDNPPSFSPSFIAMPIGACLFGYIADKHGSPASLFLSMLVMGTGAFAIGIIPPYKYISAASTLLYMAGACLLAFSFGGELTVGLLYLSNLTASPSRFTRYRYLLMCSLLVFSVGTLAAALVFYTSERYASRSQFKAWVWRVPFILTAFLTFPGLFARMGLPEDKVFQQLSLRGEILKHPLHYVVGNYRKELFVIFVAFGAPIVAYKVVLEWFPKHFERKDPYADGANLGAMAVMLIVFVCVGFLCDRLGLYTFMNRSLAVAMVILVVAPAISCFVNRNYALLAILEICMGAAVGILYCPIIVWLSDWVTDLRVRCTIFSLGFHLSYLLFNTTVFFICNSFEAALGRYAGFAIAAYFFILIALARVILWHSQQRPFEVNDVEHVSIKMRAQQSKRDDFPDVAEVEFSVHAHERQPLFS